MVKTEYSRMIRVCLHGRQRNLVCAYTSSMFCLRTREQGWMQIGNVCKAQQVGF